jgi:hypothetical protein
MMRTRILVESLENLPQLVALRHRDRVEGRPVENDIGAFALGRDLDTKAVEVLQPRIRGCRWRMHGSSPLI